MKANSTNSNKAKGKRKLEDDKTDQYPQSKKVRKYKQDSSIEELGSRFPIVMNEIMSQLNDETLVNLKSISYKMHKIVDQETNSWLRKLKKLISWDKNEFHEDWKKVIVKIPVEIGKSNL